MVRRFWLTLVGLLALGSAACPGSGEDSDDGHPLQSRCVQDVLVFSRDIADGYDCSNFGYADCGNVFASDCVNYCAFDVCQAEPCTTSTDCNGAPCEPYVISGESFGAWCHYDAPPAGGGGNPCGDCGTFGSFGECCGGMYCAGECVGSPCCY